MSPAPSAPARKARCRHAPRRGLLLAGLPVLGLLLSTPASPVRAQAPVGPAVVPPSPPPIAVPGPSFPAPPGPDPLGARPAANPRGGFVGQPTYSPAPAPLAAPPAGTVPTGTILRPAPLIAAPAVVAQAPAGTTLLTPADVQRMIAAAIKAHDEEKKGADATKPPAEGWGNLPVRLDFTDGVLLKTRDDLFSLRMNNLLQVDYRDFSHTAQGVHTATSLHDNFTVARWWVYLTGNATEYVDYQTVFAAGAANSGTGPANINILDAWLDFNPFGKDVKEYFQIRVGRMKTPFLYQFYKLSPQDFVTPELSMFSTNFLQNRQIGIMAHGLLFDKRLDYAAGVFNGVPNSFDVVQSDREAVFYLGLYPFVNDRDSLFKNLVLAGSYAFGEQNGPVAPASLGTAVPSNGPPNNLLISPTFLTFGSTTVQTGNHQVWNLDLIWCYRSFNLYSEVGGGQEHYGLTTAPAGARFPVSLSGYSVAATYFLTGEQITPDRRRVKPLAPYNWHCGGLGAFEVFGRFSNLVLGSTVFTDRLANPALFANSVNATDIGVNWYLNEYIKVVFDWQHAYFNHPISLTGAPGGNMTRNEDIFWWRFQLYY